MALRQVITYSLAASSSTIVINAAPASAILQLNNTSGITLDTQRRLLITTTGNESANTFTIKGLNLAGFPITETILGPNASTTQTNLDFYKITSVTVSTATVGTTSLGTDGAGSSLWQYQNRHVTPVNISLSCVPVGTTAINYSIQYTYDDPNNPPAGQAYATPFNFFSISNATAAIDGAITAPIEAWRVLINSGTGTVRATGIQAGIAGP